MQIFVFSLIARQRRRETENFFLFISLNFNRSRQASETERKNNQTIDEFPAPIALKS